MDEFVRNKLEEWNLNVLVASFEANLKDLLPRDPRGKEIMSEFVSRNRLDRAKLAALIIDTQLGNNIDARISQSRFIQLAKEIIEIFPDEKLETYYKPYYRGSEGAVPARGILWDRYLYKRRVYRKIGLLKKPKEESLTEQIVEDKENVMNNLEWLKHNIEPFDEVMKRWLSTTSMRLRNLITIKQYFETYRCLQRPNGYVLIDVDFEYLYPHCKDNFFSAWSQISNKIITHAREVAEESSEIATLLSLNEKALEDGNIDIVALLILPLMLGSISLKANKANNHWRPSKLEVQTGFILHVETVDDMQPALEKRQRLIEKYKLTDQPLPIFIGQLTNLVSCSVKINDTMFTVSSPLKAIDICFKSFFVLNARYPIEAAHIWTFIEIYVYGIKNDSTKNYTKVNKLISTLNMQSV